MARDCYKVFKAVYSQAIADGLGTAVATAAAQASQQDCLNQQSAQVRAAQPIVVVDSQPVDRGPTAGGSRSAHERAATLGVYPDTKKVDNRK